MTQPNDNPLTQASTQAAASYVDSDAWSERLDAWGAGYSDLARAAVLQTIARGGGPRAVASQLRKYAENVPVSAAESLSRTLQLTAYRDASVAMEKVNGDFIVGKIRIATLDDRCCLSCVALHGTPLDVGERVDDHYNGRCTDFYQVKGGDKFPSFMQSDSTPGNRNFVPWQTGEDWFASLSPERQAAQAAFQNSPAMLAAYNSGVPLSDFVAEHMDPIFGRQVVQNSLVGAVGAAAAKEFYK